MDALGPSLYQIDAAGAFNQVGFASLGYILLSAFPFCVLYAFIEPFHEVKCLLYFVSLAPPACLDMFYDLYDIIEMVMIIMTLIDLAPWMRLLSWKVRGLNGWDEITMAILSSPFRAV